MLGHAGDISACEDVSGPAACAEACGTAVFGSSVVPGPQDLFNACVHKNCTGTTDAISVGDDGPVACIMSCAIEQFSVVPQSKYDACLRNCTFSAWVL